MVRGANHLKAWWHKGLETDKNFLRRTNIDPGQVQKQWRRKEELLNTELLVAMIRVVRRLHLSPDNALLLSSITRTPGNASQLEPRSYIPALKQVISADSAADGELLERNVFAFDQLLPTYTEKVCARSGLGPECKVLEKYFFPFMQISGNKHVVPNLLRLHLAPYTRSRRQNALALHYQSAFLTGGSFKEMADLDEVQEKFVKDPKLMMPQGINSKDVPSALTRIGCNLDLCQKLRPTIVEAWGGLHSRKGGGAATARTPEIRWMRRSHSRALGDEPDTNRTFDPTRPSLLDEFGGAHIPQLNPCTAELGDAKVWTCLMPGGAPPQLQLPGALTDHVPSGTELQLFYGMRLVGVTFFPRGFEGGDFGFHPKLGVMKVRYNRFKHTRF